MEITELEIKQRSASEAHMTHYKGAYQVFNVWH